MEWELSNPQVFWTDNAAHHNLVWWRWDFFSPLARKRQIKWRKRKRERGASSKYIFEQQWPVVYLMIALLLLNLTSLSSLSVPINMFPLRHSWNSLHINSQNPTPHLFSPCYSTICYYSLITECLCQSDIWTSQYVLWYKSSAYNYALLTLMLVY